MTTYAPPLSDMLFWLQHTSEGTTAPSSISRDSVAAILEQGGRFAAETIAPLNRVGDTQACRLDGAGVVTPPGWKAAYDSYASGGWIGASIAAEHGGMGLPYSVGACLQEMLHSANMAFALCPMLTQAAIKAIALCGSDDQKQRFLPQLMSGQWTGTMVLTEPQAGSDLSAVRTRAERFGNHYLIRGQKIFITYGDHDLTENIIHLVLARTSGQESGTKGLSLFIVPKRKIKADGSAGDLNDVRCVSLEHKLGIHGSPTACLAFGDNDQCIGELVGELGRGLEYMFIMMNEARLSVGIQGLAIAERAYQAAAAYANERVQGRAAGEGTSDRCRIRLHPDVHRMLMTMRATCEAMRGLVLYAMQHMDAVRDASSIEARIKSQAQLDFLVPIVKGWCTERACEVTSIALQIYGGMGYVEETGAAQHFRDARITTIYEGTTGIQANDLVSRKIRRGRGVAAWSLIDEMRGIDALLKDKDDHRLALVRSELAWAIGACDRAIQHLLSETCDDRFSAAVSVHYVHLFGLTIAAWTLARGALAAIALSEQPGANSDSLESKIASAHFFAAQVLPEVRARLPMILDSTRGVLAAYPRGESPQDESANVLA